MEGLTPRFVEASLTEACSDTPVVVVQGPRQCGKTTLVQQLDLPYVTLDDGLALDAATSNPEGWLAAYDNRLIIDEVQRAQEIEMELIVVQARFSNLICRSSVHPMAA